ncbi:hypothetical protein NPIL_509561 [Nephila pilipes]|uniref:Uncharacterized protein n=1 Tax=Nephila pilipes TaxID=299642 RepID=A0A8X6N5L6_NEPPI|nr:hypothetical protein NPIL_509561 [Nephila pilipes]
MEDSALVHGYCRSWRIHWNHGIISQVSDALSLLLLRDGHTWKRRGRGHSHKRKLDRLSSVGLWRTELLDVVFVLIRNGRFTVRVRLLVNNVFD